MDLKKHSPYIVILLILFPAAIFYGRYTYAPTDDAYIFLVYARNFVEGNGLTYNGAVVEGFSSILWVAALSLLGLLQVDLPILAEILSILTGIFALFATYILARSLEIDRAWALLPPILLAVTGDFTFYMTVGLEQVLFTALVALSTALSYSQEPEKLLHTFYYPLLLALMILTRPEGALISGLLLIILAIKSRSLSSAIRCGLVLTLFLAPVLIWKRYYFGYWLPNTFYAKSGSGLSNLDLGIKYLARSSVRYWAVFLGGMALAVWGYRKNWLNFFKDIWPLVFISVVWIVYVLVLGGDNMVGGRVIIPILPLVYVALVRMALNLNINPRRLATGAAVLAVCLLFGYLLDPYVKTQANNWRTSSVERQAAGLYLQDNFPPDTVVALNAAGIIPYYSKMPTIDMLGLNDIYIARHGKRDTSIRYGHQAGDGEYVLSREPDVILFKAGIKGKEPRRFLSDQEIWNSQLFWDNYELQEWENVGYAYVRKE